jgi:hypothetical protein
MVDAPVAPHGVVGGRPGDEVAAVAPLAHVLAGPAPDDVVASSAEAGLHGCVVVGGPDADEVVAVVALQHVVSRASVQQVPAQRSLQAVVAVPAEHQHRRVRHRAAHRRDPAVVVVVA